ncbi:DivIVA domain-containing protein [Microbacterium sp. EYE_5]|uniref:DivIVA domain-containing protein n=1 Tax=unclassified Microbacterium TaxID=2609290 RepID=UPI0020031CDB|nr:MULTISPECIES: DivIVA domain-containing protein [unclassified Microbacterium]MCK6080454.1 DivIVA domain-containing protein [Microbacterium sp. EYE_382]MCK6085725.1 DivIVA domain-containing protein [Microbacterium sp. EYE_384]MCK6124777.1 DivIVA domain-containing protein [Microbacterium sp. EYE_80]MCK6127686.1 DivIVA domain-containing protein [Microbacterium sp. EYE_79]MCK6141409.1 DivIVA domain-containing protein [Microbacterium sp. EYE_39]
MPLTPEDVVTKQFQHVRFKEGFDPDEVDDFLDEIVVEWRKALAENEELKAKLAAYESGETPAAEAAPAAPETEVVSEVPATPEPAAESSAAPVAASAGIIELAQRLHDEHVAEGKAQKEKLVSEAQTEADAILNEARTKARDEITRLESERGTLEARISELRQFERDYRVQLRSFIEEKLRDLDVAGTSGSTPISAS